MEQGRPLYAELERRGGSRLRAAAREAEPVASQVIIKRAPARRHAGVTWPMQQPVAAIARHMALPAATCFVGLGAFSDLHTGRWSSLKRTASAPRAIYPMHMSVAYPAGPTQRPAICSPLLARVCSQAYSPLDRERRRRLCMQVPIRSLSACLDEPTPGTDVRTRPMHGARMTYI